MGWGWRSEELSLLALTQTSYFCDLFQPRSASLFFWLPSFLPNLKKKNNVNKQVNKTKTFVGVEGWEKPRGSGGCLYQGNANNFKSSEFSRLERQLVIFVNSGSNIGAIPTPTPGVS